jgi:hypothetical protein
LAFIRVFFLEGICLTNILDDGKTDVEVESLRFAGQTVAGYDFTVVNPVLSGLMTRTKTIERTSAPSAAVILLIMQAPLMELRGGGAQLEVIEQLLLVRQLIQLKLTPDV